MSNPQETINWRILADRFIWSDEMALTLISREITDKELQIYLYMYHGDYMSLEEIRQWREEPPIEEYH